jgi:trimethylamine---corrinoid protein Co-methyltransferase
LSAGGWISAEQAPVDLEICRFIHSHFESAFDFGDADEVVSLIQRIGIRGSFVTEDHTLGHFRESWFPQILDRSGYTSMDDTMRKDIYRNARRKVQGLLASDDYWEIDAERAREIDKVVASAERIL